MASMTACAEALDFESLIEQVTDTNEPIFISGNDDRGAVLVSEAMWEEIQERFDTMIADQCIDALINGKSKVYTFDEVMKKLNLDKE